MNRHHHQDFPLQTNYQKWLDENNVQVQSQLFKTTTENVVAGWGCVATSFIKEGTILFEIPREACFTSNEYSRGGHRDGSSSSEDDEDDADVDEAITCDTQKKLALKLLREMENSERDDRKVSKWKPFLDLLTPHPLPWTWPKSFREKVLLGTELEKVVEKKVERIRREYKKITSSSAKKNFCISNTTYQQYLRATSLVASHANPWFGVSIVPFNTTLNCPNVGDEANVEFDLVKKKLKPPLYGTASGASNNPSSNKSKRKGRNGTRKGSKNSKEKTITQVMIVGKAMTDIQPGQELFQQYGDSVAELVYRCGFAPRRFEWRDEGKALSIDIRVNLKGNGKGIDCYDEIGVMEGDVVSLSIRDIVQCVEIVLKKSFNRDKEHNGVVITSLLPRMEALKQSGAIDESPWDGLNGWEYVTAEISMPSKSFMSAHLNKNNTDDKSGNNSKKRRRNDDISGGRDKSVYDDGGISKLIGICLVLMASEEEWQRISTALKEEMNAKRSTHDSDDDDEESRSDDIAASSILASLANLNASQTQKLRQLALDVGQDDNDPWRALLLFVSEVKAINLSNDLYKNTDGTKKKQKIENSDGNATPNTPANGLLWKLAIEAARLAIQKRMDVLLEGEHNCMSLFEEFMRESQKQQSTSAILSLSGKKKDEKDDRFEEEELNYEEKKDAINTVQTLRNVEKSILLRAVEVLDDASTELIIEHDVIN